MVKKIISFATAILMLCCMIPFGAFADDVLDDCPKCGKHTYETWKDYSTSVPDLGFPVSGKKRHCTSCKYSYYEWNVFGICGYKDFDNGGEGLIDGFFMDYLKDWCSKTFGKDAKASGFQAGGGSASPGGVGRNPSGYSGQGVPTVNSSGVMFLSASFDGYYKYSGDTFWLSDSSYKQLTNNTGFYFKKNYYAGSPGEDGYPTEVRLLYTFTVPADGIYYIGKYINGYEYRHAIHYFKSGTYGEVETKFNFDDSTTYHQVRHFNKGEVVHFEINSYVSSDKIWYDNKQNNNYCVLSKFWFYPMILCFEPDPDSSTLSNQTNITINNNTFNGNIYVDSSNKLTYIYPQYTVNNETKISNNPIIYNEETKQYYVYDQTTNNYYYITYGDPAPTPTPSPSPDPGGSTPDPGKPTPTPTPGGSDSSGDGSSGNPFKWLGELFKDILEGILKGLWKIITSIFGFVLWLISLLFKLFPWMPNSALVALCGGVVVVTIIRIIKFITGR